MRNGWLSLRAYSGCVPRAEYNHSWLHTTRNQLMVDNRARQHRHPNWLGIRFQQLPQVLNSAQQRSKHQSTRAPMGGCMRSLPSTKSTLQICGNHVCPHRCLAEPMRNGWLSLRAYSGCVPRAEYNHSWLHTTRNQLMVDNRARQHRHPNWLGIRFQGLPQVLNSAQQRPKHQSTHAPMGGCMRSLPDTMNSPLKHGNRAHLRRRLAGLAPPSSTTLYRAWLAREADLWCNMR